jgi:CoA:oxalate CoA-transferase
MERSEPTGDPRFVDMPARLENIKELTAIIEDWLQAEPDTKTALAKLEAERVPVSPVLTVAEAMRHPHLLERGTARRIDHPVLGPFLVPGNPLRFSEGLPPPPNPALMLGEHNREVLRHYLELTDDRLMALEEASVLVPKI